MTDPEIDCQVPGIVSADQKPYGASMLFLLIGLFLASCQSDQDTSVGPLWSAGKETASLVAVAGDSVSCRDQEFWRTWCERFGELPGGACEAVESCMDGDTTNVAAIASNTRYARVDPKSIGLTRYPQGHPSTRLQRWVDKAAVWWAQPGRYDALTADPDSIGLVPYPFRTGGISYTLWGWPSPCYFCNSPQPEPEEPEPEEPADPCAGLSGIQRDECLAASEE